MLVVACVPGAEGAAGIDHDLHDSAPLGWLAPREAARRAAHRSRPGGRSASSARDQSSGTGSLRTSTRAPPAAACSAPRSGSSPGRAVDRVLDDAVLSVGLVHLLDPAGRELEQLCERRLGLGAPAADREPDQPRKAARMRSKNPSPPSRSAG